jgi:Ser/Thr protein kinase RdoA (MazF antagonist)
VNNGSEEPYALIGHVRICEGCGVQSPKRKAPFYSTIGNQRKTSKINSHKTRRGNKKMIDIQYNLQFEKLCNFLQLGEIIGVPEAISGGLLHRMYAIETTLGKYAVKALNPQIMRRPAAMQNYIKSEQIANIAANTIPALPAKKFDGTFMQEIDNQFYLVFDWIDGESLKPNEIKLVHCEKIGSILADIHMTDFSELAIVNNGSGTAQLTDWNYYLQKGRENNTVWVNLLLEVIDKLYDWNTQANKSASLLATDKVISHRDLDPKNVMWNQDNPIIIDWEAAGCTNPMQELTETAIYWSENKKGNIDKERFLTFIGGYKKRYGTLKANWRMVLASSFLGKLDWLEYNLKRSLWIECTDEKEQQMGTDQVTGTINAISRYADMISELEEWLNNEI